MIADKLTNAIDEYRKKHRDYPHFLFVNEGLWEQIFRENSRFVVRSMHQAEHPLFFAGMPVVKLDFKHDFFLASCKDLQVALNFIKPLDWTFDDFEITKSKGLFEREYFKEAIPTAALKWIQENWSLFVEMKYK